MQDTTRPVLSNIPNDITVECNAIPAPPSLNTLNAQDNCDAAVNIVYLETEIRNPDPASCDHWTDYQLKREWTASDNCGNSNRYTQIIQIEDTTPPALIAPANSTIPADSAVCGAEIMIPAPVSLYDICSTQDGSASLRDTSLILNTSGGPNSTTPVDTLIFSWTTPNTAPLEPVIGNASLSVSFQNSDIDGIGEFFKVYGENGDLIGQTTPTGGMGCQSATFIFSIPPADINRWLNDGQLTLKLASNTSGGSVNAVCSGSRAFAHLTYNYAVPQLDVQLQYTLDGGPSEAYPPSGPTMLGVGVHHITYTATDCQGNAATASTIITIEDTQPPVLPAPTPQIFYVAPGPECEAVVTLPFPTIHENCDFSGELMQASAIVPVQFSGDNIPNDLNLTLSNLIPNAIFGGQLVIRHKGDNHESGEFFYVFDENNIAIDTTSNGPAAMECMDFHETTFNVSASQINAWAANGTTQFKLVANDDVANYLDLINPCGTVQPDMTDGNSRVQAILRYSYAQVTYEIRNSLGQLAAPVGSLTGNSTTINLKPGIYQVKYLVLDINGLEGSVVFPITVRDTIAPQAKCKAATITISPSGFQTFTLNPTTVNNGSLDNCSPVTLTVSPNSFTCNDAAISPVMVTLTVADTSGNISTCKEQVQIKVTAPTVNYSPIPLCEGDPLQLTCTPPNAPPNTYSFSWAGPNFGSNFQNPIINPSQPQNAGTYTVTVTGRTGCTSSQSVNVILFNPTAPSITASKIDYCAGENIVLAANPLPNVEYLWYVDSLPMPILMQTTPQPFYTIINPAVGTYRYYARTKAGTCLSQISQPITIHVHPIPPVAVEDDQIVVCAGETITLGSPVTNVTYVWTGPGSFMSDSQFPWVTSDADSALHHGIYTLKTVKDGCQSPAATVQVTVKSRPDKPLINGDAAACVGDDIVLATTTTGVEFYEWRKPDGSIVTTPNGVNAYQINDITMLDAGGWQVRVRRNGCYSDWSDPFNISVQDYPLVTANVNTPICAGDTLFFTATTNTLPLSWCWTGPNGFIRFTQNAILLPGVEGMYTLVGKTLNGCTDSAFVNVQVIQPPAIDTILVAAPVCGDGVTDATLTPVVIKPNPPVTYMWMGPNGFSSSNPTLVLPDVSQLNNGSYSLVVKDLLGCISNVETAVINVQASPQAPALNQPAAVCEGTPVTISISNPSAYGPGATFTWIRPFANDTSTTQKFLNLPNPTTAGMSGAYFVYASDGACLSDTTIVNVTIKPLPTTPLPFSNSPVCTNGTIQLNISNPQPGVVYDWDGPAGFDSGIQNPPRNNAIVTYSGPYCVKATLNGCVSLPGECDTVVVIPPLDQPVITGGALNPQQPTPICYDLPGALISLNILTGTGTPDAEYTWYNNANGQIIGGPSTSPNLTITNLAQFGPGVHSFRVKAEKEGCESALSAAVYVRLDTIPDIVPYAGSSGPKCLGTGNTFQLDATPLTGMITGKWTQIGGPTGISIQNDSDPKSLVLNAIPGSTYMFRWTLSNGGCTNFANSTVSVTAVVP
ncbi:MAG: immunoglobulin domain-containing protein, partial [Saprospiraceae bacterium]|nr:immunoglobulin domain-containing protein [Saprospiraceae bacterium]